MHPNLDQIQNHEAFALRSLALEAFADLKAAATQSMRQHIGS